MAGDGGVRDRDDCVERIMQRRAGRLREGRVGAADRAQLAHREAAHLLAGAQAAQSAAHGPGRHAQVRAIRA
jgi:hypothetical protein